MNVFCSPGVYYYHSPWESMVGGKFRLELNLYGALVIAVQTSYDKLFHTKTYGAITLTLPLDGNFVPDAYRTVPVRREEIMVTKKRQRWQSNF